MVNEISPLVENGHDACPVYGDGLPRRLGHVEMSARGVAPAAVVVGKGVVGRAEVGGGDGNGLALAAPLRCLFGVAHYLIA